MSGLIKTIPVLLVLATIALSAPAESDFRVVSPDGRIEIKIRADERISYSVFLRGKPLLQDSTLSIDIDHTVLGLKPRVKATKQRNVAGTIEPAVRQKFARIPENYNEIRLEMEGGYAVVFRAYNEGAAYRIETALPGNEVKVYNEEVSLKFAGDYSVYYPKEDSFFSHNERRFLYMPLKGIEAASIASVPAVVDAGDSQGSGVKIAIADSDVEDYPGLWFRGTGDNSLSGTFPPYPLKQQRVRDRDFKITQNADYIAVTRGTRTFPWRLMGIAERDADLLTNQLVYLLAKPSELQDTSWIKPGKVAWDWWNANNIYGVDFRAGINTETYKYYIDFAAKYGLEYVILDEGWYKLGNLLSVAPAMNIEELVAYGKQKKVGIILWVVWKTLDDQFEPALNQFEKWGVKGIKVDFMQRDDQQVMNFYAKVCGEAAKRKMMVDFHGAIRPSTMVRTWPNLINTEGVQGMEHLKWSDVSDPAHNVTIPFTRMFLGPMDYTPGAMLNAAKGNFAHIFNRPMSMGTRCHELAMYVVYESPLQMLADSPSNYMREPEAMEFLSAVPTVWDETKVLAARIGEYVCVARRHGTDWYIGAMTDWTRRDLDIDLSFLPEGSFRIDAYQDGVNADRYGADYKKVNGEVSRSSKWKIKLAEGGGWAARITPVRAAMYQDSHRAMWTTFEIVAYGAERAHLAETANAAFEEIDRLDRQMSNFAATSELTYINRNAARGDVIVEKELFDFLKASLDYSRATGGAFDITVGPLMRAWGFFDGKGRVPGDEELAAVTSRVGYQHVHLNESAHTIRFDRDGVELDLGGIAKGYAVDKAAQILRDSGVDSALITSGGSSICAVGAPPGEAAWRVEVSDPTDRPHHVATLELKDQSISTSGCHEKSLTSGGKTYCHIMDPRAGHPIEGILGATIVTKLGVEAEALSKAVMVIGVESARKLLVGRRDTRAILYYRQSDGSLGSARLNFDEDNT